VSGPKRDDVTGNWKRMRDEKNHGLCPSPNIIRTIKPRRMKWGREAKRVLVGQPEEEREF
jgi:hypothetical protein